jgi:uncharacterized protein
MISVLIAAFVMGAIGSMHCIGMCGPIALSLPVVTNSHSSRFVSTLLYNMGRIITYAMLGLLFGAIGMTFRLFGFQQLLSITLGVLILFFIFFPKNHFAKENPVVNILKSMRAILGKLFYKKNYQSVFSIGLLNGLLPCGLVYIALAGATETASPLKSSLFMAAFGLGTLPLMWTLSFFGSFMNIKIRTGIKKLYPVFMFAVAVLLILRGLDLKIPYLSPSLNNGNHMERIECHD